jgi:hypothetical protein
MYHTTREQWGWYKHQQILNDIRVTAFTICDFLIHRQIAMSEQYLRDFRQREIPALQTTHKRGVK